MTRHIFMRFGDGFLSKREQNKLLRDAGINPGGEDHVWIHEQIWRGRGAGLSCREDMFAALKPGDEVCVSSPDLLAVSESDVLECFIKLSAKGVILRIASPPLVITLAPEDGLKFQAARLVVSELAKRRTAPGRKTLAARREARTSDPSWQTLVRMMADPQYKLKDISEATGYPPRTIHNAVERGELPARSWNKHRGRPAKSTNAGGNDLSLSSKEDADERVDGD